MPIHLVSVGKLKDPHLKELERKYLERLSDFEIHIHEIKTSPRQEQLVLKKVKELGGCLILLTERGRAMNSCDFGRWFNKLLTDSKTSAPVFVISGAEGPGSLLREKASFNLSLSPLTFPHQWVRPLLIEQFYRIQCTGRQHPYNK